MQALLNWTLEAIRDEGSDFSWMEEIRFDWTPLIRSAILKILEGQSVLILSDDKREWFSKYILSSINCLDKDRPLLPIYSMQNYIPKLHTIGGRQDIELVEDVLDISFSNGYFLWYIGENNCPQAKIAYRNNENFLWTMNDQLPNSIFLMDSDPLLDIKLIQLYKLFDKTLEAVLCQEVDLDE